MENRLINIAQEYAVKIDGLPEDCKTTARNHISFFACCCSNLGECPDSSFPEYVEKIIKGCGCIEDQEMICSVLAFTYEKLLNEGVEAFGND